jgi:uncharacterized repeat protein (TIGR03803 family)
MTTIEKLREGTPSWVRKSAAMFVASLITAAGGASSAVAQTETLVYSFAGGTSDGANPYSGLSFDGSGNLIGAADAGGSLGQGIIFKVTTAGIETVLYNLPGSGSGAGPTGTPVVDSSGNIYGTAAYGSITSGVGSGDGVVFKLAASTYAPTTLWTFSGSNGANPFAGVVLDSTGANLYGTTVGGGAHSDGTVYKVPTTTPATITTLNSFAGATTDGNYPYAGVIFQRGGNLFGTTALGGPTLNAGTVYMQPPSVTPDTIEHPFGTSANGSSPRGRLVADTSNNLYGTTFIGGNAAGDGVIFELTWNGISSYTYSVLHTLAGGSSEGANPWAGLVFDNSGNLYGTAPSGGTSGYGVVFEITSTGAYSTVHNFAGGINDGANPYGDLLYDKANNILYGTTANGGASSKGTVFKIAL